MTAAEPTAESTTYGQGVSVRVRGDLFVRAQRAALDSARVSDVPQLLVAKDPDLWGPQAEPDAAVRLGWLDLPAQSRGLLGRLTDLWADLQAEGLDHIVLAGMGGSSLAPEVIARTDGVELTVLDTTDAGQIRRALGDRLDRTVLVVSSKSGGTLETDSHRRAYEAAFTAAGIDAARRIVVVTDPGSPLEATARAAGYRDIFLANPDVGGRYSALSAFGLVPSALAGVDVSHLLDSAIALSSTLDSGEGNPALALGAVLGGAGAAGVDKIVLADHASGIKGFGDWAEQLVAESTGKDGKGLLPVVVEGVDAPGFIPADDVHLITLGDATDREGTSVSGPLGAQFLAWEYAIAVAGRTLGIDPFDQPNVQESKDNTAKLLESAGNGPLPIGVPALVVDGIEVYADPAVLGGAKTLSAVLSSLLALVPDRGYLAIMAYLDRGADTSAALLRPAFASRLSAPVTFGWGPRFLHSTGQYHKGGPQHGVFLQLTGDVVDDLDIPGRPFSFSRLQMAQALGDVSALASRSRPVIRLHLTDRGAGLRALQAAVADLDPPEGMAP